MKKIRNFIITNFKFITYTILFIPVIVALTSFLFLDLNNENIFLLFLFFLSYYLSILYPIFLFFWNISKSKNSIRSCFEFIKKINFKEEHINRTNKNIIHETEPLVGVEVGVMKGNNAKKILEYLNIKKLYLVDPWVEYSNLNWSRDVPQKEFNKFYQEVKNKFANNNNVEIIREFSVNAAKNFRNDYFDFIYIDGDHTYDEIYKDLIAWYPKLKKYGVMCGDDFGHKSGAGVMKAVIKFTNEKNLQYNYSLDRQFWFVKI